MKGEVFLGEIASGKIKEGKTNEGMVQGRKRGGGVWLSEEPLDKVARPRCMFN